MVNIKSIGPEVVPKYGFNWSAVKVNSSPTLYPLPTDVIVIEVTAFPATTTVAIAPVPIPFPCPKATPVYPALSTNPDPPLPKSKVPTINIPFEFRNIIDL